MMQRRAQSSMTLHDSQRHGAGCELFVVEGESAANAVAAVRDARTQAVLACQGKPLNAWRASPARVAANPLYRQWAAALGWPSATDAGADAGPAVAAAGDAAAGDASHGTPSPALAAPRFGRVLLLLDPDADGIHIGALLLLYLQRFAPALLAAGHVWMVRAPLAGLRLAARDTGEVQELWADTPEQARTLRPRAAAQGERWQVLAELGFRGLASLPPEVLRRTCVDATTRRADAVTPAQMQAVIDVFGGAG